MKRIIPFFSPSLPVCIQWTRGKASGSLPLTFHPEHEFHFIKEGRGAYYIEGKTYAFGARHLVIIRPNQVHSFAPRPGEYIEKATLIFRRECAGDAARGRLAGAGLPALISLDDHAALQIELILKGMLAENARREKGWEEIVRGLLGLFLLWVKRLEDRPKAPRPEKPLFAQLRRHVEERCADPACTVTQIAREFGYSLNYLSALFKEATGIGIKHYLLQYRIVAARKIIGENPGVKIESVARQVGFRQYRNFSRAFLMLTGISPSLYRKNYHVHRE